MEELLQRYTPAEQKVIEEYWEVIRFTRSTGKISDGIKQMELEYWQKFEPKIVMKALVIHIDRYAGYKETYTRGIMKNLANERMQQAASVSEVRQAPANGRTAKAVAKPNRFANFAGREIDYEVVEHLEQLKLFGQLEAKREELMQNPRYAKYL